MLSSHLIACDVSGYGLGGPRTDDKAFEEARDRETVIEALWSSLDL
ncbi:MAG: hypothetical protein OXB92_16515 [Acidimicrobiaceae bacterium]|nr:hypothetical protein [Acidimicrobiaceae bacterium]